MYWTIGGVGVGGGLLVGVADGEGFFRKRRMVEVGTKRCMSLTPSLGGSRLNLGAQTFGFYPEPIAECFVTRFRSTFRSLKNEDVPVLVGLC